MSTHFTFCSDVSILGNHLANILLIPKIRVKRMWTKPELMLVDFTICWTVRHLSSKTIWWMAWTYSSMVKIFRRSDQGSASCCSWPVWIPRPTSSQLHRKRSPQQISVSYPHRFSLGIIFFFCRYFVTTRASILFISKFVADFSPLYGPHQQRN